MGGKRRNEKRGGKEEEKSQLLQFQWEDTEAEAAAAATAPRDESDTVIRGTCTEVVPPPSEIAALLPLASLSETSLSTPGLLALPIHRIRVFIFLDISTPYSVLLIFL